MNFARDVVEAADPQRLALIERARGGGRREWSFAEVARAIGLFGVRVEHPSELDKALHDAFDHDGPAVIEVMTVRHELEIPPGLTFSQVVGFALWGTRSILSGDGKDIINTAKSNLRLVEAEFR